MDINKQVAENIKNLLKAKRYSVTELAAFVNKNRQSIYDMLSGRVSISLDSLVKVAEFLKVTPSFLLRNPSEDENNQINKLNKCQVETRLLLRVIADLQRDLIRTDNELAKVDIGEQVEGLKELKKELDLFRSLQKYLIDKIYE